MPLLVITLKLKYKTMYLIRTRICVVLDTTVFSFFVQCMYYSLFYMFNVHNIIYCDIHVLSFFVAEIQPEMRQLRKP